MNRITDLRDRMAKAGLPAMGAAAFAFAGMTGALSLVSTPALAEKPAAKVEAPTAVAPELAEAVTALRAITTMRADFTQTDRVGQRVSGVLTLKRPGRIRFQYAKGVPMLIVGDGRALTFVDTEIKQMQRWPIGNSPLGALLDPNRDVTRFGRLQPTADRSIVSIEVRDRSHPEYGAINLIFLRKPGAPGGMELTAWVALDSQNQRTTIRLANQQYGMPLDDAQFRVLDTSVRPHK